MTRPKPNQPFSRANYEPAVVRVYSHELVDLGRIGCKPEASDRNLTIRSDEERIIVKRGKLSRPPWDLFRGNAGTQR
ncbi:MAG: hypothetical protein IT361_02670 [Gemmatimonadaceae bacterium]|nr:hypothetical protein [Gemmatimonadaceae bacterium]